MKKKGFTLIELLAVIVILAIIALIAVPIVLNMIENARKSAAKSSAYGYIQAIEDNNELAEMNDDYQTGKTAITGTKQVSQISLNIKGKKPDSGEVTIDSKGNVSSATLCINGYTVTYTAPEVRNVTQGCDESTPYVYSTTNITQASDGSTTAPYSDSVYFRYELEDGEIPQGAAHDVCMYSSNTSTELCFSGGEYETSLQKLQDYYSFDSTTWTKTAENNGIEDYDKYSKPTNNSIACYDYSSSSSSKYMCSGIDGVYGDPLYVYVSVYTSGIVRINKMVGTAKYTFSTS